MSWVAAAIVTSSVIGSNAAKQAANTQASAAREAAQLQKEQFDLTNEQQKPYREAGYSALSDIGGMKPYLTQQYTPEDFTSGIDPSYAFRLQQGREGTNRMANLSGGMISGNALKGQEDYSQGLASTEYGNAFNRFQTQRSNIYNTLASIAGLGQTSLGQTTAAGTTAAGNIGANMVNAGAAQAGGIVGQANALSGGLQQFGNQQYLSNLLASKNAGVNYGLTSGGGSTGGGLGLTTPSSNNLDYMGGGGGIQLKT
jgi:hypothetical protein